MADKLYFAYGSNINLEQMAHRCPRSKVVEPVVLENYELLFRGNGGGCGVATIAPREGCLVHGLLWKITPESEQALDFYEGFPHLYNKQLVNVTLQSGAEITVMAYVMTREKERLPTEPTVGYYKGIREGFQQNGLPVKALEQALRQCWREVDTLARENAQRKQKKGCDTYER